MAQSPEENAGNAAVIRYDLGWKAINDLLRSGRSLSGYERNSCFLNLGDGQKFADVSSALKLDFDDDGRVLALSDWDYDGDIDFWIANRNGPQIRFLKNEVAQAKSIAFRLFAKNGNRDAIGARITLVTDSGQQTQTLRAGEGYLSQNSKWLHFGLGDSAVQKVIVRWPQGTSQELTALPSHSHLLLFEGQKKATPFKLPKTKPLTESPVTAPPVTDRARLSLLRPLPLPELDGLSKNITGARLVNLWLSTCPTCKSELTDWKEHASEFAEAGVEIVAINVDPEENTSVWEELDLPFTYRFGTPELVEKFDVIQRSLLSRQRPLPVPSSFLISASGELCAVYKGPIDPATIIRDASLAETGREQRLAAAMPFPGQWLSLPAGADPQNIAIKFIEGGYLDEAEEFLTTITADPTRVSAPLFNLLGALYLEQKRYSEAARTFIATLRLDSENRKAHEELVTLYLGAKRGREAESHVRFLLKADPKNPDHLVSLAKSLNFQGKKEDALKLLQTAPQTESVLKALKLLSE
ncbi:MAG: ASPIC/UnbV domain-containing protein [Akkermansiaceae bacterium]